MSRPFRASLFWPHSPGRCPGLVCFAPSGLSSTLSQAAPVTGHGGPVQREWPSGAGLSRAGVSGWMCRLSVGLREGLGWVLRAHTLSPHFVPPPCPLTLSPHLVPTPCPLTLSPHLVSTPCLHTLSLRFVESERWATGEVSQNSQTSELLNFPAPALSRASEGKESCSGPRRTSRKIGARKALAFHAA